MDKTGSFTLPGEAGYEELTLRMAKKWGADVIRDSDGTALSDEITKAGYDIYSTICIIRDHNEWARKHMDKLQQSFLMSKPVLATDSLLAVHLMDGYFEEQFMINDSVDSLKYWEVYDRTANCKVPSEFWNYEKEAGNIVLNGVTPFHVYTVNFLAYRIWEEISMYNHVTNGWDKEHLMPIDPRTEEAQNYLLDFMEKWCISHPDTTVVRFTSLFYNFVWIWGSDERNRNLFTDWGSYDFTVSPKALDDFKKEKCYALTSEDFINGGKYRVTHMPPNKRQLDYMNFTNRFVVDFGRKLIDIVHKYGKKAYVFYDDSWVGLEPYSELFKEFNFDGLIKCVFSGYEARLCAGVDVETHELRLHPYLFPVGLGGLPTFSKGGNPALDAKKYWISVRRALMRQCVDRLGLGGYLHLTEGFPDFQDYIEELMNEFRTIKSLHESGDVYTLPVNVSVLHSWGKLRSWTLSGHFHETYMNTLIHINEALSGLPVNVNFISFDDVKNGCLKDADIVINAGRAGTAWSGGDYWNDSKVIEILQQWVFEGGAFIGVGEPSASNSGSTYFKMSQVLGVDLDTGARVCHGKWPVFEESGLRKHLMPEGHSIASKDYVYLVDPAVRVIAADGDKILASVNKFGKGKGIYLSDFEKTNANTRMLLNILLYAKGMEPVQDYLTDNADCECAYYPDGKTFVVFNNSDKTVAVKVKVPGGVREFTLEPFETKIVSQ